ncbi:MAG: ATP synthase F1 subunit epsilon [Alphaproteobacteria bacterium]|nr:MAG: ATP synthase F1 subunit epsilon [Alphaproteobacteria bacterium]
MSEHVAVEVVTPERRVLAVDAAEVVLPGEEGDMGVLAGHAPVVTLLRPGLVEIRIEDGAEPAHRLFVKGGFAEIAHDKAILLVEEALDPAAQSLEEVRRRIREREIDLEDARDAVEAEEAERDLRWLRALAEILERSH